MCLAVVWLTDLLCLYILLIFMALCLALFCVLFSHFFSPCAPPPPAPPPRCVLFILTSIYFVSSQSLGKLRQLRYLDLAKNRIETLDTDISGCENLEDLLLSSNMLQHLPDSIGRHTHTHGSNHTHTHTHRPTDTHTHKLFI